MDTENLRRLGRIARLQIQRSALKRGEKPNRWYDPAPILAVDELTLTPEGAVARLPDGAVLVDVHHAGHPQTRNLDGTNDISVGFMAHYAQMRERFGAHLADGCAGENILVETSERMTLETLGRGLLIRSAIGQGEVRLAVLRIAPPCREFSTYAGRPERPEELKAALQFLDDGLRGFYCAWEGTGTAVIAVGDEVWAAV